MTYNVNFLSILYDISFVQSKRGYLISADDLEKKYWERGQQLILVEHSNLHSLYSSQIYLNY